MTATLEIAPETRPYEPHGAAAALFYSQEFEVLIDGPAGTGKTRAVCEKCHLLCQEIPNMRILWVRATRASMSESVLMTFETKVVPEGDLMVTAGARRWFRHDYLYPNGSQIVLGGMDNVERIMSTEYDIICVFEATEITEHEWETLTSRARNYVLPYQQVIADCNPSHPRHWLWLRAQAGKMRRLKSEFSDNPSIKNQYLRNLSNLSGHRRSRLYEGLWAAAEGLVYPDGPRCFVEHYEPPVGILVGGIDWGWSNPFCALAGTMYVENEQRHLYIWYERYLSKCLMATHAERLPTGHRWWADPSQPESIRALYQAGHRVAKATNPIIIGIDAVTKRIEQGTLRISDRCRALRAEMDAYRYPDDKLTEKPVDEFNHACDALRYLVMGVDRGRVAK